jgi:hypothetical protein
VGVFVPIFMENAPKSYVVSWRNVVMAMFNAKQNDKKNDPHNQNKYF